MEKQIQVQKTTIFTRRGYVCLYENARRKTENRKIKNIVNCF